MKYLFTYGTLKKGFLNHHFLEDCKFISRAITCEKYQMYPAINYLFPFLIESERNSFIKGEVYLIDEKKEEDLDYLENYPIMYIKKYIKVRTLPNNEELECLIYIKNEEFSDENMDKTKPITEWTDEISGC